MIHQLKTWPIYFDSVKRGEKTFELRTNDRNFLAGDTVILRRFDPTTQEYTGEKIEAYVPYVLYGKDISMGLKEDFCILSLKIIS